MSRITVLQKLTSLGVSLAVVLGLVAGAAQAQDALSITQVDPSGFPEMVVYIDAEASRLPAGLSAADFEVTEDGQPVQIVDFAGEGATRPVDIVFVFDTTQSMGGEIAGAIRSSVAFAEQLRANNRDFRLGLVAFGDEVRAVANADGTLTADVAEFTDWVRQLRAEGGGDDPEAALDALDRATTLQFRPEAQKVLLLITDALPHERGDGTGYSSFTTPELTAKLRDAGFVVYAVAVDDPSFRSLAGETGGQFYELTRSTDFSTLIDTVGGDIAKQYRLTYLSPRSSYDGTQRAIAVNVAGKSAEQAFLEPHLLNIQSSLPIFLVLLVLLLAALAAPSLVSRAGPLGGRLAGRAAVQDTPVAATRMPAWGTLTCPACGRELRVGARFCGGCGARLP